MSKVEVHRFLYALKQDPRMLEEFNRLRADAGAAISWASGKGYALTPEEAAELAANDCEMTDDELDEVAGGDASWNGTNNTGGTPPPTPPAGGTTGP